MPSLCGGRISISLRRRSLTDQVVDVPEAFRVNAADRIIHADLSGEHVYLSPGGLSEVLRVEKKDSRLRSRFGYLTVGSRGAGGSGTKRPVRTGNTKSRRGQDRASPDSRSMLGILRGFPVCLW